MCAAATEVDAEVELTGGALALSSVSAALVADILLASAANAINQADRNIMPIAVIPMAVEFHWSLVQRGLVLSSFAYGYILTQLPGGWIATRLPPLRLLLAAVSGWSLTTLLTPSAAYQGLGTLFACRVVMGVAEGFCLPAVFQLFATRADTPPNPSLNPDPDPTLTPARTPKPKQKPEPETEPNPNPNPNPKPKP